ncbi:STM4015 family protein [Nocardiopsis changdeensis]|uniref:STM4015 family protein n=1 Tax=Nocardiopsis changdeensis TaxID=2831969 RepID=A0ABX8BS37_9ACTN|nr:MULTISPECIES: STM4015 family protein [Nocardiopsis]QUX23563.1 STM4015 family protein [Nocardiopsis changdeensis]QYX39507.1 STM4015 family protein [Nocardiopsis sp. MT53]
MSFGSHLTEYAGLPVFEYRSQEALAAWGARAGDPLAVLAAARTPGAYAWRLADAGRLESKEGEYVTRYYERFCADVDPAAVTALVLGSLEDTMNAADPKPVRNAVLACAPRWTGLRSLFYGDVTAEEYEVSWLNHGDLSGVLNALPGLERLDVRGTGELSLPVEEHRSLRSLTLQGGGLPAALMRQVLASRYPALEHLELWLGMENYEGDATPADLAPLLSGEVHAGVRSLGLRNAEETDPWVRALAGSPVLERLEVLDLSLGTLTDEGAQILLDVPGFRGLSRLDLHHHFMSEEMGTRVVEAFTAAGVEVDVSERVDARHGHPYPAVGE